MRKKIICIVLIVIIILTVIIINNRTGYDEYSQKIKLAESEIELILKKHIQKILRMVHIFMLH